MYVSQKEACKFFGVSTSTLRRWDKQNKIKTIRTPSNYRRYDISSVKQTKNKNSIVMSKKKMCYCRVSSKKQMDDLERQKDYLKSKYPNHEIISDIGSGINWKRKGLLSILEQSNNGLIEEVVVAHKDRLARFAFELIQWLLEKNGCKLVVLNEPISEEEKLTDDILSIIHIFSCRKMGMRKYKKDGKSKDKTQDFKN
ncbi:uncharacterized protein METZ01_LOCUS209277 [marine metagenome]|jgi:putative resolvase|uniref:Resolvase/invertase-type recombinase catalytic domain-containing protein n=1 Tax=marine metagenome TaxID=408172 RepID=A0A382F2J5_9ZZZZ